MIFLMSAFGILRGQSLFISSYLRLINATFFWEKALRTLTFSSEKILFSIVVDDVIINFRSTEKRMKNTIFSN